MHVCFVSSYFPQACGIASYTHYLAESLCQVTPGIAITVSAEGKSIAHHAGLFDVRTSFQYDGDYVNGILEHIDACCPDFVHIQHEYGIFGLDDRFHRLLDRLRARGVPTVVTLHSVHTRLSLNLGCAWRRRPPRLDHFDVEQYQKTISELASKVIVHQEAPMRQVLLRQGICKSRVATVPHGTLILRAPQKAAAKTVLGFDSEARVLAAFGYFEPSKNALILIEAFREVKRQVPDTKLWIGGFVRYPTPESLKYRSTCEALVHRLGLTNDVTFATCSVPEQQVPDVLAAADIACFIYDEDTRSASGALHRAIGLGRPVVASRIPKFHEVSFFSDETLVNPRSASEAARVLLRLLQDSSFRQAVEQRTLDYAERTTWSTIARRHLLIYDELAAGDTVAPFGCEYESHVGGTDEGCSV